MQTVICNPATLGMLTKRECHACELERNWDNIISLVCVQYVKWVSKMYLIHYIRIYLNIYWSHFIFGVLHLN